MPPTLLCLSSYEKGQEFLRAATAEGARVFLLTVEKLRDAAWPREALADLLVMPSLENTEHVLNAVSYLGRQEPLARVVALDEFDLEQAAALREHLRLPGLGVTATRHVRDKLAMREAARAAGLRVPEFCGVLHHPALAAFMDETSGPWLLKPRSQASAIGIRKLERADEMWPILDALGDLQSHHLVEQYVPGQVYHVDGIVVEGELRIAEVHRYARPPFDVMHGGGVFCTATLARGSAAAATLTADTARVVEGLGVPDGALHAEFIRSEASGEFYFLEVAARVGGAHIAEMVEAATGINLWREWGRLEVALASGASYQPPEPQRLHAGVLITLARQEWPDTRDYDDAEIVWRLQQPHHAGLIVVSSDAHRVDSLLQSYMRRFVDDFQATLPAPERATQ